MNLIKKQPKKNWGNFGHKTITTRGQAANGHIIPSNVFFGKPCIVVNACKHHDYVYLISSFGCEYRDRNQKPCWIVVKTMSFIYIYRHFKVVLND
jgi:hypothetical protein